MGIGGSGGAGGGGGGERGEVQSSGGGGGGGGANSMSEYAWETESCWRDRRIMQCALVMCGNDFEAVSRLLGPR
jgi:hypothetical protein